MNKFVTVFGVAAVVTLAGCKDPNYKSMSAPSQDEVKVAEPTQATPTPVTPVEKPTCKCLPGTKHSAPCACGAPDCKCVVEVKPVQMVQPVPPPPAVEPEYTVYIVQNGDFLSKISKRYNITVSSIKRLNGLKGDTIRIGQKLKLPGKIDVGVQTAPARQATVKKATVRAAAEYKGATKEYVVKNGDTLGAIAYGNGCNIRQLKKMNNLTSDSLKIGQKLKVPAEGKAAKAAAKAAEAPKAAAKPVDAAAPAADVAPAAAADSAAAPVDAAPAAPAKDAAAEAPAPAKPAEPATTTYVVQESDDMTGVTIRFGVTAAAIRELNNLAEDAQLTPGQVIKLPADAQQ